MKKIQVAQNKAQRISTGAHLMSSIDYLHDECEAQTLKVVDHSELLWTQYLVRCLEPDNVCHNITTRGPPPRQMKQTLYTRGLPIVEPRLANNRKQSLQVVQTAAVHKANDRQPENRVIDDLPLPISNEEISLNRGQRTGLAQLRSGHSILLNAYKHRIGK